MLDSNFWVYQEDGEWVIDVYDALDDKYKGSVVCETLKDVSKALLDVSDDDDTINIEVGEN